MHHRAQSPLYSAQSPLYSARVNMSSPTGIADPYFRKDKAIHTMIPNTSTQSQDLFKYCLGFPRQLSQSPGVYYIANWRSNLEKILLNLRLEILAIFMAKGKALAITGETREEGNLLERECLLLETME